MNHNREFQIVPPVMLYFNEYYGPAAGEELGTWMSSTAIFEELRHKVGSGLKANGVSSFGRYLRNISGLRQKLKKNGVYYLVRRRQPFS